MPIILRDLIVYTDGASRCNPGHASCAFLVGFASKDPFKTYKQYLGDNVTNNQAEYRGMALALAYLVELITSSPTRSFGSIIIHSDSQLVVGQINGKWKVRDADLKVACEECHANLRTLRERGHEVILQWVPREKNSRADQLCNEALNEAV